MDQTFVDNLYQMILDEFAHQAYAALRGNIPLEKSHTMYHCTVSDAVRSYKLTMTFRNNHARHARLTHGAIGDGTDKPSGVFTPMTLDRIVETATYEHYLSYGKHRLAAKIIAQHVQPLVHAMLAPHFADIYDRVMGL